MSKCDRCATPKELCSTCRDNPIYAKVTRASNFMAYIPTCPRGYKDCVGDPAYIKFYHPEWYKKLYGDKTPYEAAEECRQAVIDDPNEEYYCYDDEDK